MNLTAQKATLLPDPADESRVAVVLGVVAGDELYGFPLSLVREILVPPPITEVPRAAPHILGVITVRGQIITVVDLATLLDLPVKMSDKHTRVLLIDDGDELIGVAVNRVIQVYRIEQDQIEYASAMSAELSHYIVGVGRVPIEPSTDGEDVLILVDPVALLGD